MSNVVLLHGFGQTSRCWGSLPGALERAGHTAQSLDAPGHGDNSELDLDLLATSTWLATSGGRATYIGYSMGARMCLHAALLHPDAVERLVLISGTGGIDDDTERAARVAADEALATRIESFAIESFVDEWLGGPLFAHLTPEAQMRDERLRNSPSGLATSLRRAGTGTHQPGWSVLRRLQMPVLIIAGALDPKFADLARRLGTCIGGNAAVAIVGDAGHTVHLEQPVAVRQLIVDWLSATDPKPDAQ